MDEFLKANREVWDKLAKIHHESEFYDVEGFLKGNQTLDPIEIEELPDISGKKLLHLQCHFGMDTLSLARLGADVTGVDFSSEAIDLAKTLSKTAEIDARFICSNVYDIPKVLDEQFDIVFTSGGVLVWLPDLDVWAKVISSSLKKGGIFYIREFHPFSYIFDDEDDAKELRVKYPYFQGKEPLMFEVEGSYASGDTKTGKMRNYEWNHPISEIFKVLINHGLRIDHFHEFPFTQYKALPFMIKNEKGRWVLPEKTDVLPLMFSIMATKMQ
ncbi:MAG: class I SAM-dependent methyltransferase [Candidatus Thorarchaeota archaeon]|nr:MAG: class I SAM-dependent methyltransferase [Candidatus Thorarchaeota archaeon]